MQGAVVAVSYQPMANGTLLTTHGSLLTAPRQPPVNSSHV